MHFQNSNLMLSLQKKIKNLLYQCTKNGVLTGQWFIVFILTFEALLTYSSNPISPILLKLVVVMLLMSHFLRNCKIKMYIIWVFQPFDLPILNHLPCHKGECACRMYLQVIVVKVWRKHDSWARWNKQIEVSICCF